MLLNKERAKTVMNDHKIDVLIASSPENITYASGYPAPYGCLSDVGILVVLPRDDTITPVVITSRISSDRFVASDSWIKDIKLYGTFFIYDSDAPEVDEGAWTPLQKKYAKIIRESEIEPNMLEALKKALEERGLIDGRLGIDERNFLYNDFERVQDSLPRAEIVPAYHLFRVIRTVKTDESIQKLRRAAQINEMGLLDVLDHLKPGKTEQEMWEVYAERVRREGAIPYNGIFSGGTQGFLVNKAPSNYILKSGEGVKLDSDCIYAHHYSDMALTASIGHPSKKLRDYSHAVHAGLLKAEDVIRPGATPGEVLEAAVNEVRKNGIPHYDRHHVGHGLGLECYDIPLMDSNRQLRLEEGTVVNIEIPYYEIGFGSAHVENTFLVTATGCERFQKMTMELKVL